MLLTPVITEAEEGGFIALNPETGTTTQSETYQEAQNLVHAFALFAWANRLMLNFGEPIFLSY